MQSQHGQNQIYPPSFLSFLPSPSTPSINSLDSTTPHRTAPHKKKQKAKPHDSNKPRAHRREVPFARSPTREKLILRNAPPFFPFLPLFFPFFIFPFFLFFPISLLAHRGETGETGKGKKASAISLLLVAAPRSKVFTSVVCAKNWEIFWVLRKLRSWGFCWLDLERFFSLPPFFLPFPSFWPLGG